MNKGSTPVLLNNFPNLKRKAWNIFTLKVT
jgi:hypothetical protein